MNFVIIIIIDCRLTSLSEMRKPFHPCLGCFPAWITGDNLVDGEDVALVGDRGFGACVAARGEEGETRDGDRGGGCHLDVHGCAGVGLGLVSHEHGLGLAEGCARLPLLMLFLAPQQRQTQTNTPRQPRSRSLSKKRRRVVLATQTAHDRRPKDSTWRLKSLNKGVLIVVKHGSLLLFPYRVILLEC
jgi:hypothetical protein